MADTTVRYPGPLDAVEVLIPENERGFDAPRHQIVERGGTLAVSAGFAERLVESGFEPVEPEAAEPEAAEPKKATHRRSAKGGDDK
jgi:hypothetical protein